MQKFNYHTHTSRCKHAYGNDEEYVIKAIEAGYERIGFSDHAPYSGLINPEDRMEMSELSSYQKSIAYLKDKYKDQIEIYFGLEVENYDAYHEDLKYFASICDYVIVGQHSYVYGDDLPGNYYRDHSDDWTLTYGKQIKALMESGWIDYVAHPDLFMTSKPEWNDSCIETATIICETSKRLNIPLEINLGGMRWGKKQVGNEYRYAYPYRSFWEIAEKIQCPVVYGLDAHKPEKYLDKNCYIEAEEILKGLKLNFVDDTGIIKKKK